MSNRQGALPFGFRITERTENLPEHVSPLNGIDRHGGIDSPIGYAVIDGEVWVMFNSSYMYEPRCTVARFRGPDFEHQVRQPDGVIDVTDVEPGVGTFFCGGMWYDASTGRLYAPIHCEYEREIVEMAAHAGWCRKKTRLASSGDKGLTWRIEGDILTDYMPDKGDWLRYSGSYFAAGPADFDLYVDSRGGYIYIFLCTAYALKTGKMNYYLWYNEAARCAIGDKMAPGKWFKFCNGTWSEPGLGGRSSRVSMGAYGIYGRVIYSRYLDRYLRIGCRMGIVDTRFTELGFKDSSIYLSACSDLAKQDWSPVAKLFDKPDNANFGITLTDGEFFDPFVCDRNLHVYSYWLNNVPSRALDVELDGNATTATDALQYGSYAYEPHPESGDPIESRQTKIVGCANPDTVYAGDGWQTRDGPQYLEQRMAECSVAGSSVALLFRGSAVYWRAEANHDCGKADVFIDDVLAETVDGYYREAVPYQFAFIRTGLDPDRPHTIRVAVRGDKAPGSSGTAIRHIAFEYAAESYKASAGYSGVMGKNHWHYRERHGQAYADLSFFGLCRETVRNESSGKQETRWYPANCWRGEDGCTIGGNYQTPGNGDAVREWVAPHAGTVRIEGTVQVEGGGSIQAAILSNSAPIWPGRRVAHGERQLHDVAVTVDKGDAIRFVVTQGGAEPAQALWDPVVTFVQE